MTVKIYISRNPDGTEHHFRESYERNAALQIAKAFWRAYHSIKSKHYALIFNLQATPADVVIISNDGMGIVDMKHIGSYVEGDEKSKWYIVDGNGGKTEIRNNHLNPAKQVADYKLEIGRELKRFASTHPKLPSWLHNDKYVTQGAILFTSDRFSKDGIILGSYEPWLKLLWLDDIADWAQSLSFQHIYSKPHLKLTVSDIDYIAANFFNTSPWLEIDELLSVKKPYGFLFLIEGNQGKVRLSLEKNVTYIGRSRGNDISLEFPSVSGSHCELALMPDGVFLVDLGSAHGTWLNGLKLIKGIRQKIITDNEIILGRMENGVAHESAAVLKYKASTDMSTTATIVF